MNGPLGQRAEDRRVFCLGRSLRSSAVPFCRTIFQHQRATVEAKIAVAVFNVRARSTHPVLAWPTF